jgi:uncharacterized protein (DUF433 family)
MNPGEIVRDGKTGKAVVAGTDVTVGEILAGLAELGSVDALLHVRPALVRADVDAALRFAAGAVDRDLGYGATARGAGTRQVHEPAAAYGNARTVVVDADEYEGLLDSIELLKGINAAERDLSAGLGIPHERVMAELLEKYHGR